ncbi:MAG: GDSL-type esterase/lipase family protein [Clostridiaceae bacterium]
MLIRKKTKISISIVTALVLLLTIAGPVSAAPAPKYDLVSLGDSLAWGQTPTVLGSTYYNQDLSYTDIIASKLSEENVLGSYTRFSGSGWTTVDLAAALCNPVNQPAILSPEIITIDIGADDILAALKGVQAANPGLDLANVTSAQLSLLKPQISTTLNTSIPQVIVAINSIITQIQGVRAYNGIQPAQIYVMGYYNAFPFVSDNLEQVLAANVVTFNTALQGALTGIPNVSYVSTYESMDKHLIKYLPLDIHPTVPGYRTIAKCFLDEILPDINLK